MKIHELFLKPVERPIDGVIKADDERNLLTELEEYVVTRDVEKGLGIFTDRYFHGTDRERRLDFGILRVGQVALAQNPLAGPQRKASCRGARPADILLPKIKDEFVHANLKKAVLIPSRSVLFNIDQKFDGIGGNHTAPILEVFVKVLNELQGYFGKQGYIAKFEHDLDLHGDYAPFQETYLRVNGTTWEKDREAVGTARKAAFGKAYAAHFKVSEADAANVMRQAREDYRVSIEELCPDGQGLCGQAAARFPAEFLCG
jgi:hypothetical protein